MSAAAAPADAPGNLRRSSRSSTATATLLSLTGPLRSTKRGSAAATNEKDIGRADVKREAGFEERGADDEQVLLEQARPTKKRRGPYAHLGENPLTDRIKGGLDVLFCGENPGIKTAELQLHYASPHNHFYKCLHAANLTSTVLPPTASRTFPEDLNLGITNLIARPTREASELNKDELEAAVPILLRKVATHRPKLVAFVGIKVCETVLRYFTPPAPSPAPVASSSNGKAGRKAKKPPPVKAHIGLQSFAVSNPPSSPGGVRSTTYFYCLPSTSGRVAAYPLPVKLKIWATFGDEVAKLRASPPVPLALPTGLVVYPGEQFELPELLVKGEEAGGGVGPKPEDGATMPLHVKRVEKEEEVVPVPKPEVKEEPTVHVFQETVVEDGAGTAS
ncbi:uracil DNA N-glycosylase Thp1 [Rhodotorula kratochvilovae]